MAEIILGGCGNAAHSLRFIAAVETYACDDCKSFIVTTNGYYFCPECFHMTCTECASQLCLFYPTLTGADVAAVAAIAAIDGAKALIPCVGSSSHELTLLRQSPYDVFDKHFYCNVCWQEGDGELYHCDTCQFDAHRECAELEKRVQHIFHEHPLDLLAKRSYSGTGHCEICAGPVRADTDDLYTCTPCNIFMHALCAKQPQKVMHVAHNHILTLVPPSPLKSISCDGCLALVPGFRYTCPPCDFDLHPVCAIVPPNPLCVFDGGHRLAIEFGRRQFWCTRCGLGGCSWLYHCEVCNVDLHLHCAKDEDKDEDEEPEQEEDVGEAWNKLYESTLVEYLNTDYAAKVNLLSELLDVFMQTEAQSESLDHSSSNNQQASSSSTSWQQQQQQQQQQPATTTVKAKVNTRAESETHVVNETFAKMHVHNAQSSEDAERKAKKVAAKEAKQREKAKSKAEQDAKIESMMKLLQDLHMSRDKTFKNNNSMSQSDARMLEKKMDTIQEKIGKLHEKTEKIHDVSREIKTTQVHSKQRRVPRIVLCTERGVNMKQKLLTKLPVGIRAVQLHLLCEQPGQEHIVANATGCEINQKIGERWEKLQPLLATGLQLVTMAVNVGGAVAGVGQIFPNLGRNVWDIQAVDLGRHTVQSRKVQGEQAVADALRVAREEESAAQWLVSYLEKNEVVILDAFGLVRVRYTQNRPPYYSQGSLAWLCSEHHSQGCGAGILESFPIRR